MYKQYWRAHMDTQKEYELAAENLRERLYVLQQAGYKLCNKAKFLKSTVDPDIFDRADPSAILVIKGDTSNTSGRKPNISHAMAFLYGSEPGADTLNFAFEHDTPQEKIEALEKAFKGHDIMVADGVNGNPHLASISFQKNSSLPSRNIDNHSHSDITHEGVAADALKIEDALMAIESLGIKSVKYPYDNNSLTLLPIFLEGNELPLDRADGKELNIIIDKLGLQHDILNYANKHDADRAEVLLDNKFSRDLREHQHEMTMQPKMAPKQQPSLRPR